MPGTAPVDGHEDVERRRVGVLRSVEQFERRAGRKGLSDPRAGGQPVGDQRLGPDHEERVAEEALAGGLAQHGGRV
ncbi:hypothetical protein ACFQWF_04220 [Methylorubrum suomiense]